MKVKTGFVLGIAASLIFISTALVFSQESMEAGGVATEAKNNSETQWLWGEVLTLDAQNKMLVVKYLDYETDQEKEIAIGVNDKTAYENIKSIDELKPKDAVSIDYLVTADGKNIAKNISLEKAESSAAQETPAGVQEITPENLQPSAPVQ